MPLILTNFYGDPNIGIYGFATDEYCLLGFGGKIAKRMRALKVPVKVCKAMNTSLVGMFCAGNSSGILVPKAIGEHETSSIEKAGDVLIIDSLYTALGNLVLMNDKGIVISPFLRRHRKDMADFFGIPCEISTIAGIRVVGSVAIANSKGCLVHPRIREKEKRIVEKTLGVPANVCTVNFGSPFLRSGIIANSSGLAVSDQSSGIETGKINEGLGFV